MPRKKNPPVGSMVGMHTDIKWIRGLLETNTSDLKTHKESVSAHGVGGSIKILLVLSTLTGIAFAIWKMVV